MSPRLVELCSRGIEKIEREKEREVEKDSEKKGNDENKRRLSQNKMLRVE